MWGAPEEAAMETTGTLRSVETGAAAAPVPRTLAEAAEKEEEAVGLWPTHESIVRSSGAAREAEPNDAPPGIAGSPD